MINETNIRRAPKGYIKLHIFFPYVKCKSIFRWIYHLSIKLRKCYRIFDIWNWTNYRKKIEQKTQNTYFNEENWPKFINWKLNQSNTHLLIHQSKYEEPENNIPASQFVLKWYGIDTFHGIMTNPGAAKFSSASEA